MTNGFAELYLSEVAEIAKRIEVGSIDRLVAALCELKSVGGRLFFIGVGGSAGNCGHAVNDFRKLLNIESYAPTDNVSELTARANDEGLNTIFAEWLAVSKLAKNDALFVFSVGGGNEAKGVSVNIIEAVKFAKKKNSKVFGIVGRNDGYTALRGDEVVIIPDLDTNRITPHSEAFQAVVWHLLVSHPLLEPKSTKW